MQIVFQKGAAVSFHFPEEFRAYWDETFRRRDDREWADMYKRGIVHRGEQQALRLEDEARVALEAAVDWVEERAPSQLTPRELCTLKGLVESTSAS